MKFILVNSFLAFVAMFSMTPAQANPDRPMDEVEAAVYYDRAPELENFLKSGISPDISKSGHSYLSIAVDRIPQFWQNGGPELYDDVIEVLLKYHANPNLVLPAESTEHLGENILDYASRWQAPSMVRHLLDAGANPNSYYCYVDYKYEFWGKRTVGATALDVNLNQDKVFQIGQAVNNTDTGYHNAIYDLLTAKGANMWEHSKNSMPCDSAHTR